MKSNKKAMSPFAMELTQSMEEGLAYLKGKSPAVVTRMVLPEPPPKASRQQILALRKRLNMTQYQFALLMNVSAKTVESWEQGVRVPGGAALRMLQIIDQPQLIEMLIRNGTETTHVQPTKTPARKRTATIISKSAAKR